MVTPELKYVLPHALISRLLAAPWVQALFAEEVGRLRNRRAERVGQRQIPVTLDLTVAIYRTRTVAVSTLLYC
jgi:hypothetical protein